MNRTNDSKNRGHLKHGLHLRNKQHQNFIQTFVDLIIYRLLITYLKDYT